jgi:uncharacterized damage-inducible protein DinB
VSVFNNPASGAREAADAYIQAVLELIGDRDPVEILSGTPAVFAAVVDAESPERLAAPERPGAWSIAGILRHMADSELVWGYRLRMVLTEERPTLRGYDQDAWSDRLSYALADPRRALNAFSALRSDHLDVLDRLDADDLLRVGVHDERGDESLSHMIRLYAGHDIVHRNQIDRIRNACT